MAFIILVIKIHIAQIVVHEILPTNIMNNQKLQGKVYHLLKSISVTDVGEHIL